MLTDSNCNNITIRIDP